MRINGFGTGSVEDRDRVKTESNSSSATAGTESQGRAGQASVVVSAGTQELTAAVTRGDAARSERVANVRAQVASGTYPIDRQRLAENIADDELMRAGQR
jgi:flagellar biosynthesis anti-sigma factor FlgM